MDAWQVYLTCKIVAKSVVSQANRGAGYGPGRAPLTRWCGRLPMRALGLATDQAGSTRPGGAFEKSPALRNDKKRKRAKSVVDAFYLMRAV